ncbi:MAG: hypothetical protein ACK5U6_14250, partial [Pseudanabaena sp.]
DHSLHHPQPRSPVFSNSDRPSTPTKPDRLFPTSNNDRHSSPTKPDRPFPQIKQRSPLNTKNPIAYSLKSNSDHTFF